MDKEFTPAEVAAKVAEIIRTDRALWNQMSWFNTRRGQDHMPVADMRNAVLGGSTTELHACGTAACVAGWAAILTAPEGAALGYGGGIFDGYDNYLNHVETAGRDALGLEDYQATYLFDTYRTEDEVLVTLDKIADGETEWEPYEIRSIAGTA